MEKSVHEMRDKPVMPWYAVDEATRKGHIHEQAGLFQQDVYRARVSAIDHQTGLSIGTEAVDLDLSLGPAKLPLSSFVHGPKEVDAVETSSEHSQHVFEHSAGSITEEICNSISGASSPSYLVTSTTDLGKDWDCIVPNGSFTERSGIHDVDLPATVAGNLVLHKGDEKIFLCRFCDRRFHSSQALGGHQNAHKRERLAGRKVPSFTVPYFAHGHGQFQGSEFLKSELPNSSNLFLGIKAHSSIHMPSASRLDSTFLEETSKPQHGWSRVLIGEQRPAAARCLQGDAHSKFLAGGVARFDGPVGFSGKPSTPFGFLDEERRSSCAVKSRSWKHLSATNVDSQYNAPLPKPACKASEWPSVSREDVPIIDLSLRL